MENAKQVNSTLGFNAAILDFSLTSLDGSYPRRLNQTHQFSHGGDTKFFHLAKEWIMSRMLYLNYIPSDGYGQS